MQKLAVYRSKAYSFVCRLCESLFEINQIKLPKLTLTIQLFYHFKRYLEGYKFPVYTTEFCPRNQSEWNERSSSINCNDSNGYMCMPNENITQLIEFCFPAPFTWIEEGKYSK